MCQSLKNFSYSFKEQGTRFSVADGFADNFISTTQHSEGFLLLASPLIKFLNNFRVVKEVPTFFSTHTKKVSKNIFLSENTSFIAFVSIFVIRKISVAFCH